MECVENVEDWATFRLVHVVYPKGDKIGQLLALTSLAPLALLVSFATLIVFRRDLHTMAYFAGILLNEALNWLVKHWIREPRPCAGKRLHWVEFGMPSSHAQFMCFFASYLCLFLFVRLRRQNMIAAHREILWKLPVALATICLTTMVLTSRIYLGYHTWGQVLWGAAIGSVFGTLWFALIHNVLTPFFPIISSWRISEYFMIRDCSLIPNILLFEYTCTRAEARNRNRKSSSHRH